MNNEPMNNDQINELEICQRRLLRLQTRAEQIVAHSHKSRRVKEMELAGVRGMIEQLEILRCVDLGLTDLCTSHSISRSLSNLQISNP